MTILRIEQAISDFDTWERAFARGWTICAARKRGLRGYRIFQPVDDPNYVTVDLEFDSRDEAESIRAALADLWPIGMGAPAALVGKARALTV